MSYDTIICVIIVILIIASLLYAYSVDHFCNCIAMGEQVDKPTNTFWHGSWPREKSVMSLNASSMFGTNPDGEGQSPSFGWPQMAESPFATRRHYDYPSVYRPYAMHENEIRDLNRDRMDGLMDTSIQNSYGQTDLQTAMQTELDGAYGSKCCGCGPKQRMISAMDAGGNMSPSNTRRMRGQPPFVPLSAIGGAQLPPGAVTDTKPYMSELSTRMRYGDGKYGDLGMGVM